MAIAKKTPSRRLKMTFYLDPESLGALEAERLRRIQAGTPRSEADLSDLVNEAIRGTFGGVAVAVRRKLRAKGVL